MSILSPRPLLRCAAALALAATEFMRVSISLVRAKTDNFQQFQRPFVPLIFRQNILNFHGFR